MMWDGDTEEFPGLIILVLFVPKSQSINYTIYGE